MKFSDFFKDQYTVQLEINQTPNDTRSSVKDFVISRSGDLFKSDEKFDRLVYRALRNFLTNSHCSSCGVPIGDTHEEQCEFKPLEVELTEIIIDEL